jgi:hypothetical protein
MDGIRIHRQLGSHRFGINIGSFSATNAVGVVELNTCIEDSSGFVSTPSSVLMVWCSTLSFQLVLCREMTVVWNLFMKEDVESTSVRL